MTLSVMRRMGAIAIVVVGAVHLQQYLDGYHAIPTIGPLFLLNAIGSAAVALGLMLPIERWLGETRGGIAVGVLALGGVAIAAGSLVSVYIAETSTLFGFSEGTIDTAIWVAIISEAAAVVLLAPVAVANLVASSARRTTAGPRAAQS
jgi:hypothetical protein